jgi:hypothetical protein
MSSLTLYGIRLSNIDVDSAEQSLTLIGYQFGNNLCSVKFYKSRYDATIVRDTINNRDKYAKAKVFEIRI